MKLYILVIVGIVTSLKYDYCNINESRIAYYIIAEIQEHISNTLIPNSSCFISNKRLSNYLEKFNLLDINNKSSYNNFKCSECEKKFKRRDLLHLHNKLFHSDESINYCPYDLCNFLNCDRYKTYSSIEKYEYSGSQPNKQLKEKYLECNPDLISFYKSSCMKIVKDCFDPVDYFTYYKHVCAKIDCIEDNKLKKNGSVWDTLHLIFAYVISFIVFLYLLIIWINKYT
jgi:hypothetical protein